MIDPFSKIKKYKNLSYLELLLGKRGPRDLTYLLQAMMNNLISPIEGTPRYQMSELGASDDLAAFTTTMARAYVDNYSLREDRRFYIRKDFYNSLLSVKKDFPVDLLPEDHMVYLEFENGLRDEADDVWAAICYIGKSENAPVWIAKDENDFETTQDNDKLFLCAYFTRQATSSKLVANLSKQTLSDVVTDPHRVKDHWLVEDLDSDDHDQREIVYRLCYNLTLFTYTGHDFFGLVPERKLAKKDLRRQQESWGENHRTLSFRVLGQDYHEKVKEQQLREESRELGTVPTLWRPFWRWQRFGQENSEVKLVMVKAHEKNVKRVLSK